MLENYESYLLKEKRYSSHTVTSYVSDVKSFLYESEVCESDDIKQVNEQNVRSWILTLMDKGVHPNSIHRKISSLRNFFRWAKIQGLIEINPTLKVKPPKRNKRLPEFVKEKEMNENKLNSIFTNDFAGLRDRLIIELLYQTGIRLSECIELKESNVSKKEIKVLGKRNKERIIPITENVTKLIDQYLDEKQRSFEEGSLFLLVTDKGRKLYPKFVYRLVNKYLSYLTSLKKKSPHVLRHTFATHMLNNGAGLESIKEILGHANLSATQIYTHNSFKQINAEYAQAHPRGSQEE
jgi:integrase/recombinase XerC